MVQINFAKREINAKILLFGPENRGREAALLRLHKALPTKGRGEVQRVDTEGDTTLFFDWKPADEKVGGMNTVFQIYGLADSLHYEATLKLVVQGVDGVIFVADSRPDALADNHHAVDRLTTAFKEQGLKLSEMPLVLTRVFSSNKKALSLGELQSKLGLENAQLVEEKSQIPPSMGTVTAKVLAKLNREYGLQSPSGAGAPTARAATSAPPQPPVRRAARAAPANAAGMAVLSAGESPKSAPALDAMPAQTHERSVTARAFRRMHPMRSYPLQVIVSAQEVARVQDTRIAEARSQQSMSIRADEPHVTIRPILPGCLVTPSHVVLDTTPRAAEATFWVTPVAEGRLDHAAVEVEYRGELIEKLSLPILVTKQTLAKVSGAFSLGSTTLGPILEAYGVSVQNEAAGLIPQVLAWASADGRWLLALGFGALALLFYLWKKEKQGDPVRAALDFSLVAEDPGDPMVAKQEAKVLSLKGGDRRIIPLRERSNPIGRDASHAVSLKGNEIRDRHAKIGFRDGDGFFVEPIEGGLWVEREKVQGPERLPREAFIAFSRSGPALWFYDERPDPNLDSAGTRRKIRDALIEFRPESEAPLTRLFKAGEDHPLRRTIARLLLRKHINPEDWQRVRARFELDIPAL